MPRLIYTTRPADVEVEAALKIRNANTKSIGFVTSSFYKVCRDRGEMLYVSTLHRKRAVALGFCLFHIRKDGTLVIYEIVNDEKVRGRGIGWGMIEELQRIAIARGATSLFAKCPTELPSNAFYERAGFTKVGEQAGRKRSLNLWALRLRTGLFKGDAPESQRRGKGK